MFELSYDTFAALIEGVLADANENGCPTNAQHDALMCCYEKLTAVLDNPETPKSAHELVRKILNWMD